MNYSRVQNTWGLLNVAYTLFRKSGDSQSYGHYKPGTPTAAIVAGGAPARQSEGRSPVCIAHTMSFQPRRCHYTIMRLDHLNAADIIPAPHPVVGGFGAGRVGVVQAFVL